MKCINKRVISLLFICIFSLVSLTACGQVSYEISYDRSGQTSAFQLAQVTDARTATPFAADLCVADVNVGSDLIDMSNVSAAGLFDLNNAETIYVKNANIQLNPASLTKIMTAVVALKYGSPDQVLTASSETLVSEAGAQVCGLQVGDTMTLGQALHIMLIYSANDAANLVAEGVGGSVEAFADMMNEEAKALGATNCHFVNPNGLTAEGHYVTAYDLYLILQEALQYDMFNEIIQMSSYSTTYTDAKGNEKSIEVSSTNQYLRGNISAPDQVTVIGGKTGTTNAAGHCMALLARDKNGNPYIAVVLNAPTTDDLYDKMNELLGLI